MPYSQQNLKKDFSKILKNMLIFQQLFSIDERQFVGYLMVRRIGVTGYDLGTKDGKAKIRNS